MDRLDAWAIFAAVADQGSFVAAARRLGRSPAAVTRAVAELEQRLATRLLDRTTRSVALTDEGARYLDQCRRVLADAAELEAPAVGPHPEPRGTLAVAAPVSFGRLHVLPILQAFLDDHPAVDARLLLVDRTVSLVEEGLDVGVRLGAPPDASYRAIRAGEVRRGVYASPAYLERHGVPDAPQALGDHTCIAGDAPVDRWPFHRREGSFTIAVKPRLVVNSGDAAIDAAAAGLGLACGFSYQVAQRLATGALRHVLADFEPPPVPINVVHPAGRHLPSKVRLFVDRAVDDLRKRFAE